ncbi:MFS transporter [Methylovirgula sp. 4M-Z18]|uniref:MFS transporter n=1 Tax=Methylovirgula sp. 4M-Z18 TaxID=2293567 RepID=UPI000E2F5928|nr:MFS transporter [Methylovirgula sp. 4M-Z18]RFB78581.1 MFS transporter [Methylovirgula sp. 4M-Z18]
MKFLRPYIPLLLASLLLFVGNGTLSTAIPLRGKFENFSDQVIGLIGSGYYAGMLVGSILLPWLVTRFGAVLAFSICAAVGALAGILVPVWADPPFWFLLRFAIGISLTGVYVIIEGWLNGRATARDRGLLLGFYSVVQYCSWALGNQVIKVSVPQAWTLFIIAAAAIALAGIPLWFMREPPPEQDVSQASSHPLAPVIQAAKSLTWFWRVSPVGFVGALLIGTLNGPMWALTPVYAREVGMQTNEISNLMSALMFGSAAMQVPAGFLSDRFDRRSVLVVLCALSAALELVFFFYGASLPVLTIYALGFVLGGFMATPYYVVSAHSVDRAGESRAVDVMAVLVLLYGIGAVAGPNIAPQMMAWLGPSGVFLFEALLHIAIIGFTLWQMSRRTAPIPQESQPVPPPI